MKTSRCLKSLLEVWQQFVKYSPFWSLDSSGAIIETFRFLALSEYLSAWNLIILAMVGGKHLADTLYEHSHRENPKA
jgi:hypothetical protein